jgi:aminoglycoside phosphotransferase (APT) family kinase protein
MTAEQLWEPPEIAALGRLDPALAGSLLGRPTVSLGDGWRLHDVRWTPGRACNLTYRVKAEQRATEFVAVQLSERGWMSFDYLHDAALPGLGRATDAAHVAERLSRVCKQPVRSCAIEPVRYRPGSRCVLRYDVRTDRGDQIWYAKALQPETFARLAPMAVSLARTPGSIGLVPPLGEIWSDLKILLGRAVTGRSVSSVLTDVEVPLDQRLELGYRLGELLARFHRQSGVMAPPWSEEDQLMDLSRAMPAVEVADREFAARLRSILDTLAATMTCSGQDVLAHGSFRPGQVIVTDSGDLTVLDTDGVCRSDPGLDVGVALAHLRWLGARKPAVWQTLRRVERLLVAGYEREGGPLDRDALLWWRAAGLLKVAIRRYRRLEVDSWPQTHVLADAAEALFTHQAPDRRSRTVIDLLDRDAMTSVLSRALPPPGVTALHLEVASAEQLATATGRRTLVRYQVRGLGRQEPVAVIGKAFTDANRARLLHEHLTLLADGPFDGEELRVPEPLGLVPRYRMVLYRAFEGSPLDLRSDPDRADEGVRAAARWLGRLHGCELPFSRLLSLEQEMVSTSQWADLITASFPELASAVAGVTSGWRDRVDASGRRTVPIHKDFHPGHVLVGDGICVIDLDEARRGDPAFDVAHFCGYLELAGNGIAQRLQRSFLEEYARAGVTSDALVEPGYAAYTWLKIAKQWTARSGPFQRATTSERRVGVQRAIARAEAWLAA